MFEVGNITCTNGCTTCGLCRLVQEVESHLTSCDRGDQFSFGHKHPHMPAHMVYFIWHIANFTIIYLLFPSNINEEGGVVTETDYNSTPTETMLNAHAR